MKTQFPSLHVNVAVNEALKEKGYSVFPLLSNEQVQKLSDFYFSFQTQEPNYFYASTHSPDFALRRKASDYIKSIIEEPLKPVLRNYRLLGGAFVVKPAHGKGILQPHQDWNLVDEENTRSYNVWIPLVDVNEENGAVLVMDSSHAKMPTFRGPGIASLFKEFENNLWPYLKVLEMKAGEALLYDHALLHGSPPNKSNKVRLGVVCGLIAQGVDMRLYAQEEKTIGVFECNDEFFLNHNPQDAAAVLKKCGSLASPAPLSEDDFKRVYGANKVGRPQKEQNNFFRNLLQKFK